MKFHKHAFTFLLFVFLISAAMPALAVEAGAPAADFTLEAMSGQAVSLADYQGRVVLLKLTTTWCPTCKELSREIAKVGEQLKEQDVVFLEVFVQDTEAMISSYLEEVAYPMAYQALIDDGQVYEAYNVYLIPRLLLIDAGQVVRFDSAGRNVLGADILALVKDAHAPPGAME